MFDRLGVYHCHFGEHCQRVLGVPRNLGGNCGNGLVGPAIEALVRRVPCFIGAGAPVLKIAVEANGVQDIVGSSAHALVWLLQCISRVPPRGAPGECAISDWRRTVERLVLHRLRLHRPFRGKGNGQALCAAKTRRPGPLFVQFRINRSIQCSAVLPARFFGYFKAIRVHCKNQ